MTADLMAVMRWDEVLTGLACACAVGIGILTLLIQRERR